MENISNPLSPVKLISVEKMGSVEDLDPLPAGGGPNPARSFSVLCFWGGDRPPETSVESLSALRALPAGECALKNHRQAPGLFTRESILPVGEARFYYEGKSAPCLVVFAPEGTQPLFGVLALESLGLEVDPVNQRLKPATLFLAPCAR